MKKTALLVAAFLTATAFLSVSFAAGKQTHRTAHCSEAKCSECKGCKDCKHCKGCKDKKDSAPSCRSCKGE